MESGMKTGSKTEGGMKSGMKITKESNTKATGIQIHHADRNT